MRTLTAILILLSALFVFEACEKSNPVDQYGSTLINSYERSKAAADAISLDSLNKSVQAYQTANGKNPESIEELEKFMGSAIDRNKFQYNPAAGTVVLK